MFNLFEPRAKGGLKKRGDLLFFFSFFVCQQCPLAIWKCGNLLLLLLLCCCCCCLANLPPHARRKLLGPRPCCPCFLPSVSHDVFCCCGPAEQRFRQKPNQNFSDVEPGTRVVTYSYPVCILLNFTRCVFYFNI